MSEKVFVHDGQKYVLSERQQKALEALGNNTDAFMALVSSGVIGKLKPYSQSLKGLADEIAAQVAAEFNDRGTVRAVYDNVVGQLKQLGITLSDDYGIAAVRTKYADRVIYDAPTADGKPIRIDLPRDTLDMSLMNSAKDAIIRRLHKVAEEKGVQIGKVVTRFRPDGIGVDLSVNRPKSSKGSKGSNGSNGGSNGKRAMYSLSDDGRFILKDGTEWVQVAETEAETLASVQEALEAAGMSYRSYHWRQKAWWPF